MSIEDMLTTIRERLEAATPGPWYVDDEEQTVRAREHAGEIMYDRSGECRSEWVKNFKPSAEFIASTPKDVALLLDVAEAVLNLANGWEARGEYDMAFSKTLPDEDIAMSILCDGALMVENARKVRNAVEAALEEEENA